MIIKKLHFFQVSVIFIYISLRNLTKGVRIMQEPKRNAWNWGFSEGAENWNGRLAMIGFSAAVIIELVSGQGVLHFWGLM